MSEYRCYFCGAAVDDSYPLRLVHEGGGEEEGWSCESCYFRAIKRRARRRRSDE